MNEADRKVLRNNTVMLTKDLYLDKVFMAVLRQRNTLADNMIEDIEAHRTPSTRNAELLNILPRRGPNAFNDFIIALMETKQSHLAEALSPELAAQWNKANPQGPTERSPARYDNYGDKNGFQGQNYPQQATAHPGAFIPPPPDDIETSNFIPINLQCTASTFQQHVLRCPDEFYKMSAKPRGRCIILNNDIFDQNTPQKLPEREGSMFDVVNMTELFKGLGFDTSLWSNMSAQEIKKEVEREKLHEAHRDADAFVFIILSHGNRGIIYGQDGGRVRIQEDIVDKFDGVNSPYLIGKPKLFFIQACQGDDVTMGQIMADSASNSNSVTDAVSAMKLEDEKDAVPTGSLTHEKADMLLMMSTVPGYKSWRNTELGSWFMRDLVVNINHYAHIHHLADILTKKQQELSSVYRLRQEKDKCIRASTRGKKI